MMKKNITKLMALLLVLVMAVSMTACASDQEKMVGTWQSDVEFAPVFNDTLSSTEDAEYLSVESLKIRVILTFTEEGTYTLAADADSMKAAMESLKDSLKVGVERYLEDTIAESGMDLTIDEILEIMGTSMDELIDAVVSQEMIDEMAQSMVAEGNFKAEDGKLYMSDSLESAIDETVYDTYTLEDDVLTLVSTTQTDAQADLLYPMTFSRVTE